MPHGASTLRLFVGAYPDPPVAQAMTALVVPLDLPPHRPTRAEQIHLTLRFIGDTDRRDLERVVESVERSAAGIGTIELRPTRLVGLPERGGARLIALETDAPALLIELHRRLAHRLARHARRNASDRFLPHLTLCRFAAPVRWGIEPREVELPPFTIRSIALMRSVLRSDGMEHLRLAHVPLAD